MVDHMLQQYIVEFLHEGVWLKKINKFLFSFQNIKKYYIQ